MRAMLMVGVAAVLVCGLSGCGGDSAHAESLAQQTIDEMNKIGDNLEKGDKAAIKASLAKLTELGKEAKNVKISKDQDKAIEEKYTAKMKAAQQHMMDGMKKSQTNGKLSPDDMLDIGREMQSVGQSMKN